jgi:hypothetical protein
METNVYVSGLKFAPFSIHELQHLNVNFLRGAKNVYATESISGIYCDLGWFCLWSVKEEYH